MSPALLFRSKGTVVSTKEQSSTAWCLRNIFILTFILQTFSSLSFETDKRPVVAMSAHGCLHLNNFKAAKGTRPYRLIHSFFVACTSLEARKRKVCFSQTVTCCICPLTTAILTFDPCRPNLACAMCVSDVAPDSMPVSIASFSGAMEQGTFKHIVNSVNIFLVSYIFRCY